MEIEADSGGRGQASFVDSRVSFPTRLDPIVCCRVCGEHLWTCASTGDVNDGGRGTRVGFGAWLSHIAVAHATLAVNRGTTRRGGVSVC